VSRLIYPPVINFFPNGDLESNSLGYSGSGGGVGSRSNEQAKFGSWSFKVVTPGIASFEGLIAFSAGQTPAVSGQTWTTSIWVFAPLAATMRIILTGRDAAFVGVESSVFAFSGSGDWLLVPITRSLNNVNTQSISISVQTVAVQALTFYVDGAQAELSPSANPFVPTNGAVATFALPL